MSLARASSLPFPSSFEFRCGEPDGEGERDRPFPLSFLFDSCLNAHASPNEHWSLLVQRLQSLLSELFLTFTMSFPFVFFFPLFGSPIAELSSFRFLAVEKKRILDFLLEMSLGHQSYNIFFQFFRLFILHLILTLQYDVSWSLVSDC